MSVKTTIFLIAAVPILLYALYHAVSHLLLTCIYRREKKWIQGMVRKHLAPDDPAAGAMLRDFRKLDPRHGPPQDNP